MHNLTDPRSRYNSCVELRLEPIIEVGSTFPNRQALTVHRNFLSLILLVSLLAGSYAQDGSTVAHAETASQTVSAYQSTALTLADLEQIAFDNNPTLAAAAARLRSARGKQVQAGLYPNPSVGYHGVEMGLRDTAGQQGAFLSQRFITAGKLGLDQAIAGKEVNEAHFQFHAQEQRVLSDVRVRFYDALVAERRVTLTKDLARIGAELVRATEQLIEGRQGTENDLLQAEIRADESQILRDNADNQQIEAWRRLVAVVGAPNMERTALSGELETSLSDLEWEQCRELVLASHPTLNAARTRVDRARIVIERAKRQPIPNIDLTVSHRHHNVTQDEVTNVQLGIPIPVFDKNQGNIRSAQAELAAACNEVRRIELDLQDGLAVVYRRYANAQHQKNRYGQRIVPRAEKSLRLVTDGYQQGQVDYLTLLTAQQTYLQVNLSYLEALREFWAAANVIESQLFAGSLAASF